MGDSPFYPTGDIAMTCPAERPLTALDINDRTLGEGQPQALAELRDQCPLGYSTRYGGFWHLLEYDAVVEAARDYQRFTTSQGLLIPQTGATVRIVPPELEPPEHTTYRKMLMSYFSAGAVQDYEPMVTDIVTRILGSFAGTGSADLADDFAKQIPPLVITGVFGIQPELCEEMRILGGKFLETQILDDVDKRRDAAVALESWIQDRIDERLGGPNIDTLARIVNSEVDGAPIPSERILGMIQVLIMAGHETTIHSIASMLYRVATTPGVRDRLLADRSLVRRAVDESLRMDSPVMYLGRTVTQDTEFRGQAMVKDEKLALLYAAANRDPRRFSDPDMFDLDRDARSHLAFGSGRHRCLGEHLAVLEMEVALNLVLDVIPDYRLAPGRDVQWCSGGVSCGVVSFPAVFTPAPA